LTFLGRAAFWRESLPEKHEGSRKEQRRSEARTWYSLCCRRALTSSHGMKNSVVQVAFHNGSCIEASAPPFLFLVCLSLFMDHGRMGQGGQKCSDWVVLACKGKFSIEGIAISCEQLPSQ
jgi:hypothetical protein